MNNSQNKVLSLLGLAAKAGMIITGEELVIKAIQKQRIFFVILSIDSSDNSTKKIVDKCNFYQVPYVVAFNRDQLSQAIGKWNRIAIGITDPGFSQKFKELLE